MTGFERRPVSRWTAWVTLAILAMLLGGCGTLGYYWQSAQGQMGLLWRAESIERVLADPQTPPRLAAQLRQVGEMRRFAVEHLALPDQGAYRDYVDVGREALVWTVVATGPLSLEPKQWCFLVVGCASYRGYFRRADAETYADGLRAQGLDVAIQRVPAYSTLGWFDDPVPSTVVYWPDFQLAGLLFHELAHQRLYLPGDSSFNEAYATVVERNGVELWLRQVDDDELEQRYRQSQVRETGFLQLLADTRQRLSALYAGPRPDDEKLAAKAEALAELKRAYVSLKADWQGYAGYDRWFDRPLNNAHLAAIATYEDLVPALQRLFVESGSDFARFHAAAEALTELSPQARHAELQRLAEN